MKIIGKNPSLIFLVLIVFTGLIATVRYIPSKEISAKKSADTLRFSDLRDIPFKILIDDNWTDTRDTFDWCSGLGTEQQPYIIEDISIDIHFQDNCLEVRNTDEYFIIKNSYFINASLYAIFLHNVSYGKIDNCELLNNSASGIKLERAKDMIISNNFIDNLHYYKCSYGSGILLEDQCHNNSIVGNNILAGNYCIRLWNNCKENNIAGNTWYNGPLNFEDESNYNIFENNILKNTIVTIYNNQFNKFLANYLVNWHQSAPGIYLRDTNYTIVSFNHIILESVAEKSYDGIKLEENVNLSYFSSNLIESCDTGINIDPNCINNTVKSNTIRDNNQGVSLIGNHNNTVLYNIFENNGIHAIDEGQDNKWNDTIKGNYWDNYTGLDEDENYIGDAPYNISGSAGSKDNLPIFYKPGFKIESPSDNSYWNTEPLIRITTTDPLLDFAWYNISNYFEFILPDIEENLRTDIWNALPEESFFMNFFGNTSTGDIIYVNQYTLIKDIIPPHIYFNYPGTPNDCFYYSPEISGSTSDDNLKSCWYTFNDQPEKYYITKDIQWFRYSIYNMTLEGWYNLPYELINVTFSADDKAGNVASIVLYILRCKKEEKNSGAPINGYEISLLLLGFVSISIILIKSYQKKNKL